jgi:hypothetical protein
VSLPLIEYAVVDNNMVVIRFGKTIKISSLKNENFIVQTTASTPSVLSNPFLDINTIADYNQISRTVKLYWDAIRQSGNEYTIRLVNFIDAANESITEEQIVFTQAESATPAEFNSYTVPVIQELLVEDRSIRSDAFTSYQILAKNPQFYIKNVDPINGDFYINNDYNDGRVIISFSSRPASNFLNNKYFKVQRKKIQTHPARWEKISAAISMHSWKPEIYIDFPSLDATPVYYVEGTNYFEKGYKYRIAVSKDIGI